MRVPLVAVLALACCTRASDETLTDIEAHPPVEPAFAPPPAGPIGTAHPTTIVAVAENGRWVVACQARVDTDGDGSIVVNAGHHGDLYGDAMAPYLIRGGGEGQRIEELVATSPDERWLAIMRDGALVIIDDTNGRELTIANADLRRDQRGRGRVASFDATSSRLVYFRENAPGTIVIRELVPSRSNSVERLVRMPGVRAWRVDAEVGPWARFRFVRDDTDGNGVLDWPHVNTNARIGDVCRGPALSSSTFGVGGDEVRTAWLDLDAGTLREDSHVLAHVPRYTYWGPIYEDLVTAPDRSIHIGARTIVPASCDADVVALLPAPLHVIVTCAGTDDRAAVHVFGPGMPVTLDTTTERRTEVRPPRVLDSPIFCQNRETCFDLLTARRIALRGEMVDVAGAALLSRDSGEVFWFRSPTATPVLLPKVDGYFANARSGSIAALDVGIVDIATGRVLGFSPRMMPLAVDPRGRVLVSPYDGESIPTGPLRWADPLPQPPLKPTAE